MRANVVVVALLAACATAPSETVDPALRSTPGALIVDTTDGLVEGILDGDVRSFRTLPYATPPVGSLRWRAPRPPARWSGVRDARSFAPFFCDIRRRDADPIPAGEDCLYLNVYTPADLPDVALPVIVFLHGAGDSAMSAGDIRPTSPPRLAARGAVVVMVDWRSQTVLSTLYHPALAAEMDGAGNLGVLDLVAALRWIRDNARRFGGNPHRVLVYGNYGIPLLATPLARGLFSAMIIEGAGRILTRSPAEAAAEGTAYAAEVGCGDVPDPPGCLRALGLEQLLSAPWPPGLHWNVVQDGRVFTEPLLDALARDVDVPVIVGSGRDEASGGDVFSDYSQDPYTEADYVAALHAQYDVLGDVVGPLRELYPVADYTSPLRAQIAVDSDALVVCYMREVALAAAGVRRHHGARRVWRYLMTHAFQNDPTLERLGPHHKQMAHFALGDFDNLFGVAYLPTEAEGKLARRIQDTWIHFAATGNPNGGALHAHWPRYRPDDERMLVIDEATSSIAGYHIPQCDFWTQHPY